MEQNKLFSNAFPAMPVQDKFGQLGFPNVGLNKVEYFALEIYKIHYADPRFANASMGEAVEFAITFLTYIDKYQKQLENEKDTKLVTV